MTVLRGIVFGDSICRGFGSTDGTGWRNYVCRQFSQRPPVAGKNTAWQGPFLDNTVFINSGHYGSDGKTVSFFTANLPAYIQSGGDYDDADFIIASPLGINDCRGFDGAYNPVTSPAKVTTCLEAIRAVRPTLPVLWLNLIACDPVTEAAAETNRLDWNSKMPAIIAAQQALGQPVDLCDISSLWGPYNAANYFDGIHPNDTGYPIYGRYLTTFFPTLANRLFP